MKLLTNRLQKVILKLVHTNRYGFSEPKSILDCLPGPKNIFTSVTTQTESLTFLSLTLRMPFT